MEGGIVLCDPESKEHPDQWDEKINLEVMVCGIMVCCTEGIHCCAIMYALPRSHVAVKVFSFRPIDDFSERNDLSVVLA